MAKAKKKRTLKLRKTKSASKPTATKTSRTLKIKVKSTSKKPNPIDRPRTLKQYLTMSKGSQESWDLTGQVLSKMQSSGTSLSKAAREIGISQKTITKLAGSALRKRSNGKYVVNKNEKVLRVLVMPSADGLNEVAVRGFEAASEIGKFDHAVQKYLRTGDDSKLKRFSRLKLKDASGKRIQFLTDKARLNELGSVGVLSFESLYRRGA